MNSPDAAIETQCRLAAEQARDAACALRLLTAGDRDRLLRDMAAALRAAAPSILAANQRDLDAADALPPAMRDRLRLDPARVESIAAAVDQVAAQPDPLGQIVEGRRLASGIRLERRRIPIGVILIIYESRPNVTSDAAALCIKSGNAVILRGGSESVHSNRAIVTALRAPLDARGLDHALAFIDSTNRAAIDALVRMRGVIDLVIPRGGPGLIAAVTESARIPVIKHDAGNCHVYIDESIAGLEDAAERIVVNAKAQRPGVCNAAEKLLVHAAAAPAMLPRLCRALQSAGVEIRACERSRAIVPGLRPADDDDWPREYLDLIIAVRVVNSLDDAAAHIRRFGSHHTEAIVTTSIRAAERFIALLDSASIMVNCSTRFADGGEFGLGAEIGISTSKLHSRGPMGAADLTTTQWILLGDGQTRA